MPVAPTEPASALLPRTVPRRAGRQENAPAPLRGPLGGKRNVFLGAPSLALGSSAPPLRSSPQDPERAQWPNGAVVRLLELPPEHSEATAGAGPDQAATEIAIGAGGGGCRNRARLRAGGVPKMADFAQKLGLRMASGSRALYELQQFSLGEINFPVVAREQGRSLSASISMRAASTDSTPPSRAMQCSTRSSAMYLPSWPA